MINLNPTRWIVLIHYGSIYKGYFILGHQMAIPYPDSLWVHLWSAKVCSSNVKWLRYGGNCGVL